MNTKTVRELRSLAKDKELRGFYKLRKDDLVALLLEQLEQSAPRSMEKKRRSVASVRIISSPQEIKTDAGKAFSRVKNSILDLHDSAKKPLKGYVQGEARKENQEEEGEDVDLTPHKHERALKGSYRSFMIPGTPKTDIDSYFDQTKPHIKTLIKNQLKEMGSTRIIMTLWVIWEKPIKLLIDPEDLEDARDKESLCPL